MIPRYGVLEQEESDATLGLVIERIRSNGYALVPSGFSATELEQWRAELDELHRNQLAKFSDVELRRIGEAETVRAPLVANESFIRIAANPAVLHVVNQLLGDYFVLSQQNGILNRPTSERHHQSSYHRDLPYQHFISSRPIGVNALLCLDTFDEETGGTYVLPGTHKSERFPSDAYILESEVPISAPAGTYIVMDSMVYHRAGMNVSTQLRRGVNHLFTIPLIKQQIGFPRALNGRWSDDANLSRILGYGLEESSSVDEYLSRRLAR